MAVIGSVHVPNGQLTYLLRRALQSDHPEINFTDGFSAWVFFSSEGDDLGVYTDILGSLHGELLENLRTLSESESAIGEHALQVERQLKAQFDENKRLLEQLDTRNKAIALSMCAYDRKQAEEDAKQDEEDSSTGELFNSQGAVQAQSSTSSDETGLPSTSTTKMRKTRTAAKKERRIQDAESSFTTISQLITQLELVGSMTSMTTILGRMAEENNKLKDVLKRVGSSSAIVEDRLEQQGSDNGSNVQRGPQTTEAELAGGHSGVQDEGPQPVADEAGGEGVVAQEQDSKKSRSRSYSYWNRHGV